MKGNFLAFRDHKIRFGLHVFADERHVRKQTNHIRPGDGREPTIDLPNPWHHGSVVKSKHEIQLHRDLAANSTHYAHNLGILLARRHEVDQRNGACLRFEFSFENERSVSVLATNRIRLCGSDRPAPVLLRSKESGETRARIEIWETKPVERTL